MNRMDRYLIWLVASAASTAAVAWVAFGLQQEGFAPVVLFPLFVGGMLAAAGVTIRRIARTPSTRVAVAAAVVWGLLAVLGQDYIGHRHRVRLYDEQMAAQGAVTQLASSEARLRPRFGDYLAALVQNQPLWWTLDLVLTAGTAALATAWGAKRFPPHPSAKV